jgi:hypothetical protein
LYPSGKSGAHRSLSAAIKLRCRIITVEGAGQKTIGATDGRVPILLSALIGAAAIIGAAFATRALVSDSGYCAQFCPNANCQNLGPGNPYTDGD